MAVAIPPTQMTIMAPNENQVEAWNGGESVHYVDHAHRYDRQLLPFTEELLEEVRAAPHPLVARCGLRLRRPDPGCSPDR
jgi:hypothetical protein